MDSISSDSSYEDLVRVSSQPKTFLTVPEDTDFKVKLDKRNGEKKKCFVYTLQSGKSLPYQREFDGIMFSFNRSLEMDILESNWEKKVDGDFIIFRKISRSNDSAPSVPVTQQQVEADNVLVDVVDNNTPTPNLPTVNDVAEAPAAAPDVIEVSVEAFAGLYTKVGDKVQCDICGHETSVDNMVSIAHHIIEKHENWDTILSKINNSTSGGNVNNDPDWFMKLKHNFFHDVISKTSYQTRQAWIRNEKLTDERKVKEIRGEIIKALVEKVLEIFGCVSSPNHKTLSEIVSSILAPGYPWMFSSTDDSAQGEKKLGFGYGKGGLLGIKELPKQLWDRIYQRQVKMRKSQASASSSVDGEEIVENSNQRKGKKPFIYGVDNYKWYKSGSDTQKARLQDSSDVTDTEEREKIYAENRDAIAEQIRSSGKVITRIVRGFFSNPLHLHNQFLFFTSEQTDLLGNIKENWSKQVGYMELYLKHISNNSNQLETKLSDLDGRVQTDHNGSQLVKEVCVVRLLADVLDKDGRGIFLLPGETSVTTSPYLTLIELQDSVVFELWADNQRVLEGQNLFKAVTSYMELCFVFNLSYAKESQLTVHILQSKVARYGDNSGTLTPMRKGTAEKKLSKYYSVIGDLITNT